jgi:hypothetical protein
MDLGRDRHMAVDGDIELLGRPATQILKLGFRHGASPPTRQCPLNF